MTAAEITAVGTVAGTVVAAILKGAPAVVRAFSTARRESEKARREEEEKAEEEEAAAEARRDAEVLDMRTKLQVYVNREHACELKLTRALAWLAHLEAALSEAGIKFIPYNGSGRADSDPIAHGLPAEEQPAAGPQSGKLPRQSPPKKGKP